MATKYLSSLEQLSPKCLVKEYIDNSKSFHGAILDEESNINGQLVFLVDSMEGNLILTINHHKIILSPCRAMKLAEIIMKLYGSKPND